MFKKYIAKKYLFDIIRNFLKKDFGELPGKEVSTGRYIFCSLIMGEGSFKSGFLTNTFCKGMNLNSIEDFDFHFLENNRTPPEPFIIRIEVEEFQRTIRRDFQCCLGGIVPVSKYWVIKHIIEPYKIIHLHGREEDALRYKDEVLKQGGEKIRLSD